MLPVTRGGRARGRVRTRRPGAAHHRGGAQRPCGLHAARLRVGADVFPADDGRREGVIPGWPAGPAHGTSLVIPRRFWTMSGALNVARSTVCLCVAWLVHTVMGGA